MPAALKKRFAFDELGAAEGEPSDLEGIVRNGRLKREVMLSRVVDWSIENEQGAHIEQLTTERLVEHVVRVRGTLDGARYLELDADLEVANLRVEVW